MGLAPSVPRLQRKAIGGEWKLFVPSLVAEFARCRAVGVPRFEAVAVAFPVNPRLGDSRSRDHCVLVSIVLSDRTAPGAFVRYFCAERTI